MHIVEQGDLYLTLDGREPVLLSGGDVVLLPRGDHHIVSNAANPAPESSGRRQSFQSPVARAPVRWLCGTFAIGDGHGSHLLASLPPVITLRGARDQSFEWFEVSRRMLLKEMQTPTQGSVVMVARILDLLFIQLLRTWAGSDSAAPGWLTGALDAQIGRALAAIHADPAKNWTVESLARACNLSRSAFAERFSALVGKPPASYVADIRLDTAADLLRHTSEPVTSIAGKSGYTSAAAFSRAFRTRYGSPPARWRGGPARTRSARVGS